jgi:hypothetical protein
MGDTLLTPLVRWLPAAVLVFAFAPPAAATCAQVHDLLSQGLTVGQVSQVLNAPVGAIQACLQPRPAMGVPGNRSLGPAGPAPLSAAGPAPLGAAGPAPLGAAGPAPIGAAGPAPIGAAGPAPINAPSKPVNSGKTGN